MYFLLAHFLPSLTWKIKTKENKLFLTFDDGPIPGVTPWVLDTLKAYNAKATFFCVGENVKANPEILNRISTEGHSLGNHTMNHLNGWKSNNEDYFNNIEQCRSLVDSGLFRPPYGKISFSKISTLKKNYKIIMWDVLSRDYDNSLNGDQCISLVKKKAKQGSIIVFHDSFKAESRLRVVLPETLRHFKKLGYSFEAIKAEDIS